MSLYSAFYSGLSGLSTNSSALNVIGNNLSNINTVGFKGSSMSFRDIFSASLGGVSTQGNGNPIQFGLGTQTNAVNQDFSQSSFQTTGNALDMAIQGNGFFTLKTSDGRQVYSRAGNFTRDNAGYLVATDGSNVLGWNKNSGGVVDTSTAPVPIRIDTGVTAPANPTGLIKMGVNLDASAAVGAVLLTPIQVYDSQGNIQTLNVTYTKLAVNAAATPPVLANSWSYSVAGPTGSNINGAGLNTPVSGTVVFTTTGALSTGNGVTVATTATNPPLSITWGNGSTPSQAITIGLVNADGTSNITQYAAASGTNSSYQDGYGAGSLRDLTVDQNGMLSGTFTNGQVVALSQVAMSSFSNMNGLVQVGNNHWGQSLASGSPTIGLAGQGGRGTVLGANLELSNVDVAGEFTKLILSQRGYEANSKIVTTTDQLMQVTLNLKQ
jgi:flagellar hook protein FlgE